MPLFFEYAEFGNHYELTFTEILKPATENS